MRTTVASLVPVCSASAETVRREQPAGSEATASATACMERVMEGARARTRARSSAGAGEGEGEGEGEGLVKVSFAFSLTSEIYFQTGADVKNP
ncbi:hypothetical protein Sxan_56190 [Streptomyces xanthophaeus]|uniref:Uncharacterized protein n=1 Tax=Streptomyces xanthophaeus TaxID=67385 RepID=A0A919H0V4_9ACTN|nr:hypothetical protein Sxan_56190 [Streptomyces xanthophaeus]